MSLCLYFHLCGEHTSHWTRHLPNPDCPHSDLITSAMTPSPNKTAFTDTRGEDVSMSLGREAHESTHSSWYLSSGIIDPSTSSTHLPPALPTIHLSSCPLDSSPHEKVPEILQVPTCNSDFTISSQPCSLHLREMKTHLDTSMHKYTLSSFIQNRPKPETNQMFVNRKTVNKP